MSDKRKMAVEIAGHTVQVYTDSTPGRIDQVKNMLEDLVDEVILETKTPVTQRSLLIVLMRLADRFIELNEAHEALKAQAADAAADALRAIDEIVQEAK